MPAVDRFLETAGWARNHVEAYKALVTYGPKTRNDLVGYLTSAVSSQAMSAVLRFLEGRGAVEEAESGRRNAGAVFRARPPEEVLKAQLDELEDLLREALLEIGPSYDQSRAMQERERDWTINNPQGVQRVLQSAMESAQRRLLVMDGSLAWCRPKHLGNLGDRLDKMEEVLFVVPPGCPRRELLKARGIPFKEIEGVPVHVVVADDEALVLREDLGSVQRTGDAKHVALLVKTVREHKGDN